eukprot:m.243668 g.243668  ORF g.243668 m.243668 type:complete len:537 (+) comp14284_c0_seq1:43-1653(+)
MEQSSDISQLHLAADDARLAAKPTLHGKTYLVNGQLREWTGAFCNVKTPILVRDSAEPNIIGSYPMLTEAASLEALDAAVRAYDYGRGAWPKSAITTRVAAMEKFLEGLRSHRDQIANLLMWEICKNAADAAKEVDRTIKYIADTIHALKSLENSQSTFVQDGGLLAQMRRMPIGVVLCVGPFNYPFNETYTTLIPALIMGNCVVMKLPRCGVLCHWPTFELFRDCFPPGVVNIISGSGRETMPPLMATGKVDIFAFIGTSKAADALQCAHPKPHRLRVCLGLEAKNPAIVMPDADLDLAVAECVTGALSYNGQRCTAIKIILAHASIRQEFLAKLCEKIDSLKMGMPWDKDVLITPLPEEGKPAYIDELLKDALSKGAKIVNGRGGKAGRTLLAPTVLYPVHSGMRIYHEEQFGPLVPVREFSVIDEVYEYMAASPYGQQAALFSRDARSIGPIVDVLANQVSRVNLNTQCQRGPDSFPFTGRKDSAYGTLSVSDALRVFSIRTVVAARGSDGAGLISDVITSRTSNVLRVDYLF